jgi:hypothetical protein
MKTQQEARSEFSILYEDMKAENKYDGGLVNKSDLWEQFIETGIEDGKFPTDAKKWKMPRSTK